MFERNSRTILKFPYKLWIGYWFPLRFGTSFSSMVFHFHFYHKNQLYSMLRWSDFPTSNFLNWYSIPFIIFGCVSMLSMRCGRWMYPRLLIPESVCWVLLTHSQCDISQPYIQYDNRKMWLLRFYNYATFTSFASHKVCEDARQNQMYILWESERELKSEE